MITQVRFKRPAPKWPADVDRIVEACAEMGYLVSHLDAKDAWEAYSRSVCAV